MQGDLWLGGSNCRSHALGGSALELLPGVKWQANLPTQLRALHPLGTAPGVVASTPPFSAICVDSPPPIPGGRLRTATKHTPALLSHDRYFLDRVVNRIVDLEEGTLNEYAGGLQRFSGGESRTASQGASQRQVFSRVERSAPSLYNGDPVAMLA